MALSIEQLLAQFNQEAFTEFLQTITSGLQTEECRPATTASGGAKLRLLTNENPVEGEVLGFVLFSPNVPRPFHSAFDPDSPNAAKFTDDWFDKIVYVKMSDYHESLRPVYDMLSTSGAYLRKSLDNVDACGCGSSGDRTRRIRLVLSISGSQINPDYCDEGAYAVLAGSFEAGKSMVARDFFIAEDASLILAHPQHPTSLQKSKDARPADCDCRRDRVRNHVKRLRNAHVTTVFSHPPSES